MFENWKDGYFVLGIDSFIPCDELKDIDDDAFWCAVTVNNKIRKIVGGKTPPDDLDIEIIDY